MIPTPEAVATAPEIAAEIAAVGYSVRADALEPVLVDKLACEARESWGGDDYRDARIGGSGQERLEPKIRSDRILWLDESVASSAQSELHAALDELRLAINRVTFLGLFEWEGHFACYPPGGRYRRHLDTLAHSRERQVSTILYLNPDWEPGDGGELRLWTDPAGPGWTADSPSILVEPRAGTLVTFLAEDFYHEVLPASVERFSLTGWFRLRGSAAV